MKGGIYDDMLREVEEVIKASGLHQEIQLFAKVIQEKLLDHQSLDPLQATKEYEAVRNCFERMETGTLESSVKSILPFQRDAIRYSHRQAPYGMSMIVVMLPEGMEFPLHNHPGMMVFTKPLWGRLSIESMDLDESPANFKDCLQHSKEDECRGDCTQENCKNRSASQPHLTKEHIIKPGIRQETFQQVQNWKKRVVDNRDFSIATPHEGNIHRLLAVSDCLFLDLLLPDYQVAPTYYCYAAPTHSLIEMKEPETPFISLD